MSAGLERRCRCSGGSVSCRVLVETRTSALRRSAATVLTGNHHAFTLIECIVYIGVLTVVLTLAYPLFCRSLKGSNDLRRNADDIARVIHAGERWRDDVRHATAPPRLGGNGLRIPQGTGAVVYSFTNGVVWRGSVAVLRDVRVSQMQADERQEVESWRWELELVSSKKPVRLRPLFSFEAMARRQP